MTWCSSTRLVQVFQLIEARRKAGWTFVFLGANQDSFASSHGLSMARGATSNFVPDERGVHSAWTDYSAATRKARSAMRSGVARTAADRANYLKGFDSAERDFEQRRSTATPQQRLGVKGGSKGGGKGAGHKGGGLRRRIRQEHLAQRKAAEAAAAAG